MLISGNIRTEREEAVRQPVGDGDQPENGGTTGMEGMEVDEER